MPLEPYELVVPAGRWIDLAQKNFRQATNGEVVPQETMVRLRHDPNLLTIQFTCKNDPLWRQTSHTQHNDSLWEQEVFEVFISAGEASPTHYLELEINPNNALFVGRIYNPTKLGDAVELTMVPYEDSGITHQITHTTADSWQGELSVPLQLLSAGSNAETSQTYRINFYRIILLTPQTERWWKCTPENSSFQCWSPTMSGDVPRFHPSDYFGFLRLV